MPMISAIITTFNRAFYLEKAIKSVLTQTCADFELLILDNSSTDETPSIINRFTDSRIKYIKHPPLNISQTRNLGVSKASGEFIAFLDDDDVWLPNKLALELSLFNNVSNNVALVYGGFSRIDTSDGVFYTHQPKLKGKILFDLLSLKDDFTGSASNPMIRKSVIESLGGFDETVKTGEDWELYLRLAEQYEVVYTNEIVVNVRHHHGVRLGDRLNDYIDLEMKVMDRFQSIFNANKKLKSFYLQRLGGKYVRLGKIKEGKAYFKRAIQNNYFNYIAYIQYVLILFPNKIYQWMHRFYLNRKRAIKI